MSRTYAQRFAEEIRFTLVRLLLEAPGYCSNSSILDSALGDCGLNVSRDKVNAELQWLAEQGLLVVEPVGVTVHRVTLTQRGLDVARGESHVPGVRRADPEH